MASSRVETALGRDLLPALRHDAARVRASLDRDGRHLLRRRHLKIEGRIDLSHDPSDIVIADMTPVLAKVRRNAIGARLDSDTRRADGVGEEASPGVSKRRDVIDV